MTLQRLREIALNCADTSFIASEENSRELLAFADELERDPAFTAWSWNRQVIERIRAIFPEAPALDEDMISFLISLRERSRV